MERLSRRAFVTAAAGLTGGLLMGGCLGTAAAATRRFPIGLELYTLSAEMNADLPGTLAKVAEMGYREVELPSLYGRTPAQMRQALDAAGLRCTSYHVAPSTLVPGMVSLESDPDAVFGQCRELGAAYAVCGLPPMPDGRKPTLAALQSDLTGAFERFFDSLTLGDWKWISEFMNRAGAQAVKHGVALAYHNHSAEFRPLGETTGFNELLRLTDSKLVKIEFDCGWAHAGGQDPVALLSAGGTDRFRLLHLKDLKPSTKVNYHNKMDPAEIGTGMVDWRKLLAAAERAGVRHAYLEQEPPFARSPFDIVRDSLEYFKRLGYSATV